MLRRKCSDVPQAPWLVALNRQLVASYLLAKHKEDSGAIIPHCVRIARRVRAPVTEVLKTLNELERQGAIRRERSADLTVWSPDVLQRLADGLEVTDLH